MVFGRRALAYQNQVVLGTSDTTFSPMRLLSREQMAALLYRYSILTGDPIQEEVNLSYDDAASIAEWAQPAVAFCTDTGLMKGVSETSFDPEGVASRAMGATVLVRSPRKRIESQ